MIKLYHYLEQSMFLLENMEKIESSKYYHNCKTCYNQYHLIKNN